MINSYLNIACFTENYYMVDIWLIYVLEHIIIEI